MSLPEQHHRQPVDADAAAAVRRHPVRHRLDVVGVAGLGLGVAGLPLRLLHREALRLLLGVVELAEGVRDLHPAHDRLEALDERLVAVGRAGERGELDRPVVDDRRLDQLRLDEVGVGVVGELRPAAVARDVDSRLGQLRAQLGLVARPDAVRLERLDEAHLLPVGEVDVVAAERRLRPADRRLGRAARRAPSAARPCPCSRRTPRTTRPA